MLTLSYTETHKENYLSSALPTSNTSWLQQDCKSTCNSETATNQTNINVLPGSSAPLQTTRIPAVWRKSYVGQDLQKTVHRQDPFSASHQPRREKHKTWTAHKRGCWRYHQAQLKVRLQTEDRCWLQHLSSAVHIFRHLQTLATCHIIHVRFSLPDKGSKDHDGPCHAWGQVCLGYLTLSIFFLTFLFFLGFLKVVYTVTTITRMTKYKKNIIPVDGNKHHAVIEIII